VVARSYRVLSAMIALLLFMLAGSTIRTGALLCYALRTEDHEDREQDYEVR
jgi:hypothetical protein